MSGPLFQHPEYDAVVVGGRCAGAATGMLLARRGLRVLVVDKGRYHTDTLSTHALMRAGVAQLHRWGVLDSVKASGTPTVRTTSFHYGDEVVQIDIKPSGGVDGLYAPRRTVIDKLLVDAARQSGAEVSFETRLVELTRGDGGRVTGARLEHADGRSAAVDARIVIGADGMRSTVADAVGAETYRAGRHTSAVIFTYWTGVPLDGYHWYFRPGISAGAIHTNFGQLCVFAAMPPERFHAERQDLEGAYMRGLAASDPPLVDALQGATRVEKLRGFGGLVGYLRQSWGPGWALVGDAGYFKDPLTAHGMTDAMIDAELLANAVACDSDAALADYQATRDERAIPLFEATDAIASFAWDLPAVREHHYALSKAMKRETAGLSEWMGPAHAR